MSGKTVFCLPEDSEFRPLEGTVWAGNRVWPHKSASCIRTAVAPVSEIREASVLGRMVVVTNHHQLSGEIHDYGDRRYASPAHPTARHRMAKQHECGTPNRKTTLTGKEFR